MSRLVCLFVLVALFAVAYAVPQPQIILSDGLGLASPIGLSSWGGLSPVGLSSWGNLGGVQTLGTGTILLKNGWHLFIYSLLGLSSWNGLSSIGLSSLGGIQTLGAMTILIKK